MSETSTDWNTGVWPDWCPGCGNFGIFTALKGALSELGIDRKKFVIVSGIGCSGKIPHFVNVSGVHTLHGRAIPFATGIKTANPELKVIVHGGDGDLLGIGMGHLVAMGRRNPDILVVVHNNGVYGLTKGQASPTLQLGNKTKSLAFPNINSAINPILIGMASGYTFLARSYAYNIEHLKGCLKQGISHNGAGILEVIQPCPTWNNIVTMDWIEKNTYYLENWDPNVKDDEEALEKANAIVALEHGKKKPLGILLEDGRKEPFGKRIASVYKYYATNTPAMQRVDDRGAALPVDLEKTFERFFV
ncbi:MAG: thiamine pyrophosphate-dependent enzyme [Candidatus Verstraetearchaeota archaeon]|nr:thiamine pyrophosphate-dependent enzyme [Candidatus Verstraetearchaeota archaeon]